MAGRIASENWQVAIRDDVGIMWFNDAHDVPVGYRRSLVQAIRMARRNSGHLGRSQYFGTELYVSDAKFGEQYLGAALGTLTNIQPQPKEEKYRPYFSR